MTTLTVGTRRGFAPYYLTHTLLLFNRKSKLLDEDDDDLDLTPAVKPTITWRVPSLLADDPEVTQPQLNSAEVPLINERMQTVGQARYSNEYDVPSSPAPLSDVEQALDMTSQASTVVQSIPLFVPQAPAPAVGKSFRAGRTPPRGGGRGGTTT